MREWQGRRTIKYESELDHEFGKEISATDFGKDLYRCIQCGTCSGICPMSVYMDYTPRRIIAMTRAGFKEEVLSSFMMWLCASCYSCTVQCPKDIKITEIMYALKQKAIEEGVYPKRFPVPVLANEFFKMVRTNGRNSEGQSILKMFLKSHPLKLIKQSSLGMKLLSKGRMSMKTESIKRTGELQTILNALENA